MTIEEVLRPGRAPGESRETYLERRAMAKEYEKLVKKHGVAQAKRALMNADNARRDAELIQRVMRPELRQ